MGVLIPQASTVTMKLVSFDLPAEGEDTFHDTWEEEQQASTSSIVPSSPQ